MVGLYVFISSVVGQDGQVLHGHGTRLMFPSSSFICRRRLMDTLDSAPARIKLMTVCNVTRMHAYLGYLIAGKHSVRASDELMEKAMLSERNLSVRMTEMTAAVIRPLLANLPERVEQFHRRYQEV